MKTIWKYPLSIDDEQIIQAPYDAQPLSVQVQNNQPCLWCLVESDNQRAPLKILITCTGDICYNYHLAAFIDTFQIDNGKFVFHVFQGT